MTLTRISLLSLAALGLLVACGDGKDSDSGGTAEVDADQDGFNAADDCDDNDAAVNPGATEVCDDTIDNDCDGNVDMDDDDCDYFSPDLWTVYWDFGFIDGSVTSYSYDTETYQPSYYALLVEEEYFDTNYDDRYACTMKFEFTATAGTSDPTVPFDFVYVPTLAESDCFLDPAIWGDTPETFFTEAASALEFSFGRVSSDLETALSEWWGTEGTDWSKEEYIGGSWFWDGEDIGEGSQTLFGYGYSMDASGTFVGDEMTATQIVDERAPAVILLQPMYFWYL